MKLSKRVNVMLWILILLINLILRYPATPHEIGGDSLDIHVFANSISTFGQAKWWANPLSIIGKYPLSYASLVPFMLSGMSQTLNMDMEQVIWLFSVIIGIFGALAIYLLAGELWNNDVLRFLAVFLYSTSQGVLALTTWTATTRGFFIMLTPLFIYSLLRSSSYKTRFSLVTLIFFTVLLSTHSMIYFILPVIISYFIIIFILKLKDKIIFDFSNIYMTIFLFLISVFMILYPFLFSRDLWLNDPEITRAGIGSRYDVIFSLIKTNIRYIGILFFFIFCGFLFFLFKKNKTYNEWFFLMAIISLLPFLYVQTYMKWFFLPIAFLLICIALKNVIEIKRKYNIKYMYIFSSILLLTHILFTGYFQFTHYSEDVWYRYIDDSSYDGGLWIKKYISSDKNIFSTYELIGLRMLSISQVPTLSGGPTGLIYGFYKGIQDINITRNSPSTIAFYKSGPYVKAPLTYSIESDIYYKSLISITHPYAISFIERFNLSYVIESKYIPENEFIRSIHQLRNNIYNNGNIRIWTLN